MTETQRRMVEWVSADVAVYYADMTSQERRTAMDCAKRGLLDFDRDAQCYIVTEDGDLALKGEPVDTSVKRSRYGVRGF